MRDLERLFRTDSRFQFGEADYAAAMRHSMSHALLGLVTASIMALKFGKEIVYLTCALKEAAYLIGYLDLPDKRLGEA